MRKILTMASAALLLVTSCKGEVATPTFAHEECNGVYYWKTTIDLNDTLYDFLRQHEVRHVYLRVFDVVKNDGATPGEENLIPNASLQFNLDENYCDRRQWNDSLPTGTMFTPTVFITVDALKTMTGHVSDWADKIVTRALNMCSYNRVPNIEGLQLDCDWTTSTENLYFALCDTIGQILKEKIPTAHLSSTIRLHQLAKAAPPVDYGVLMVYNTGSFNDPDTRNSIIDRATVEPYLKYLDKYPLHLDVAYPTYSWHLLFRQRRFLGLMREVNLSDTTLFSETRPDIFSVKRATVIGRTRLEDGDIIRRECSRFKDVSEVKTLIENRLKGKPHSNILYHLDYNNLSKFAKNEIDSLYSVAR